MNPFQFNQNPKEKSCGWRCLHYVYPITINYEEFLKKYDEFTPLKSGIWFKNICSVLNYHNVKYKFTIPKEKGLFLIWSGTWDSAGGHYFIYHNQTMFDSLERKESPLSVQALIEKLETTNAKDHFVCMQILERD